MSTQSLFKFRARFLSAKSTPAHHARKSKLLTRRAEMRIRSEWDGEEDISTAPAITDIDVVASVPELVSVVEMSVMPPAMVTPTEDNELAAALHQPVHDDRDVVVPSPVEEPNWGAVPRNDIASRGDEIAPEIVPANESAISVSTTNIVDPLPEVPPAAVSDAAPGFISTSMIADVTVADAPTAPAKKARKRGDRKVDAGLGGAKKRKRSGGAGKLMGTAAMAQMEKTQDRPRGDNLAGSNGAHSPP